MQIMRPMIYLALTLVALAVMISYSWRLVSPRWSSMEDEEPIRPAVTTSESLGNGSPTIVEPEGDWLAADPSDSQSRSARELSLDNPLHHVAQPAEAEASDTIQR